jgi:hypothetical protein
MDLAYVIDHDNKVVHYNPVYKHLIPTSDYEKSEMPIPISETGKRGLAINVPTISYYDNRPWRMNIFTRPVVLTNHILGRYYFTTEYDTAIIETNYKYPYRYTSVKGEVVCAHGVLSSTTSEFTLASYLPSMVDTPFRCPSLEVGDEVEVLSWVSGHRKAKVISTNVVSGYVLNKIYVLEFSKLFKLDIPSTPGDSGGAVYTKVPPGVLI